MLSPDTWTNTIIRLDYGRSSYDVDQRFVTSFVYQLPFGRGKSSEAR